MIYYYATIEPQYKSSSCSAEDTATYGNPCNALTGEKTQTDTDLSNPVEGLSVVRTYSSYSGLSGVGFYENNQGYGIGWSTPWHKRLTLMADGTGAVAYRGQAVYVPFTTNGTSYTPHPTSTLQLTKNGTEFLLRPVDGTQERYDATGRLLSETSANGRTTSYGYNPAGRVATVTGPYGHTLTLTYTPDGHIDTLTDPIGRTIRYTYRNKNLIQVNYPDGTGRLYHYYGDNTVMPHHLTGISTINADGTTSRFATFSYEGGRQATATEHPITTNTLPQEKFQFSYAGPWTDITDPAGNKERLYITTQNNTKLLTQRTNLTDNKTLIQTYDPNNNLTCQQDETGRVTTSGYNATNQRISHTQGLSGTCSAPLTTAATRTTTTQYLTPTLNLPTVIESPSVASGLVKRTQLDYTDPRFPNLPTRLTQIGFTPARTLVSRSVVFTYTPQGQVSNINGPRSPSDPGMNGLDDVTTLTYYDCTTGGACGQLKSITSALGHTTTYNTYTPDGRVQQITDPNGLITTHGYDPRGQVAYTLHNGKGVINYRTTTYTAFGKLASVYRYPDNLTYTYTYDAAQDLKSITDTLGNSVNYAYDLKGNRTTTYTASPSTGLNQFTVNTYNLRNHVESTNHGGNITKLIHDAIGNLISETDPNHTSVSSTQSTAHQYDALNRLFHTTDLLTGVTQYAYDANDRATQVIAPNTAATTTRYDDLGNLLQEISPDRGTTQYTYDTAGNVVSHTDARNVTIQYTYDPLNRPVLTNYPSNTDVTTTYDNTPGCNGIGRVCTTQDGTQTVNHTYDNFGHLAQHTTTLQGKAYTTTYTRDPWGRITRLTYPGGRIVNTPRDGRGHITGITTTVNGITTPLLTTITTRADGLIKSQTYGNSLTDTRLYNYAGQLTTHTLGTTDTRVYTYDRNGNLKTKQTLPEVATYTYDVLDRLTLDADPSPEGYTYDANGNRTTRTTQSYLYQNNSNRLVSVAGTSVTTDPSGNLTTQANRTYTYNDASQLSVVNQNGNFIAVYQYNPQGLRTLQYSAQGITLYHYDDTGHLLQETTNTGTPIKTYVWADDRPIAQITPTPTGEVLSYLHTDALNTPRLATDTTGKVVWRWEGNAFGDTVPNEDPTNTGVKTTINLRFAGQYYDAETGLHYNWMRYYDPRLGRYISSDPIGLAGGLNTYAYVDSNPLRWIDPWGLAKCYYSITERTLVCYPNDPNSVGPPLSLGPDGIVSGQGPCKNQPTDACINDNNDGPIMPGNYGMNPDDRPLAGHDKFWRLEPDPKKPGWKCKLGLERCGFMLHPGTMSWGCITADSLNSNVMRRYDRIHDLLKREHGAGGNKLEVRP